MSSLGYRIKDLRKKRGLTQEEFGKIFGIAKSTVSSYENNNSVPEDQIKIAICKYFSVSMDYLLGVSKVDYLGKEYESILRGLACEFDVSFEEILSIFNNQFSSKRYDLDSFRHFLQFHIYNRVKTAQGSQDLSTEQQELLAATTELDKDELKKTLEYIEFLKIKQASPSVLLAARDGGGFDPVEGQAEEKARIIKEHPKSNKKLP